MFNVVHVCVKGKPAAVGCQWYRVTVVSNASVLDYIC